MIIEKNTVKHVLTALLKTYLRNGTVVPDRVETRS
jgi:hypothetical protein